MIRRENWLQTEKYLKELKLDNPNIAESSIERYEFSLKHLILWADDLSFEQALNTKAPSFSTHVANLPARRGDGKLAAESQKKIILVSKKFLEWARYNKESGTRAISQNKMNSLVHPKIQPSSTDPISVGLDEILRIASFDYGDNLVVIRDVASICLAFLSGARAGAIASAPIKSIIIPKMLFLQDVELGVETKNSKSAHTFLLPIPELVAVVKRWDDIVRANLPCTALWVAPLESHWGESNFTNNEAGENRGNALIKRFGSVYEKAGMKELYKSPHKFRHGHAVYGLSRCKNMADYQAVSRNLMHSSLTTTDTIYAVRESREREETYSRFTPDYKPILQDDLTAYLNQICKEDRLRAISILADSLR